MGTKEKIAPEHHVSEQISNSHEIVLYNDDVNSFDHVIDCLVDICDHNPLQAEQCSLLVHYKGKCTVKTGELSDLTPRCTLLLNAGLSAEIV